MKSIYIGACLLLTAGMLTSCDVLDLEPLDSYSDQVIFSDATLTEAYVTKFYTYPKNGFNEMSHRYFCDEAMSNFDNQYAWQIEQTGYTPDMMGFFNMWKEYYTDIKNINIFFNNIENVDKIPEPSRSTLIGEATFFRAFFYMDLISHFGGVPLITRTFELDDPEMMVERNSYEECADFVVTEFEKAAQLLPEAQTGTNFGRLTKGAALAYKARMLLYMASPLNNPSNDRSKWEAAAKACEEVFALNRYSLDPSYQGLFYNHQSPEIIFQRLFDTEHGHWFNWYNQPNGYLGWSYTCITQEMVDSYEMEDGSMPDVTPYTDSSNPSDIYPWANRDPRFYATVVCDGQNLVNRPAEYLVNEDGKTGGLDSEYSGTENWNYSKSHYSIRKFAAEDITVPRAVRASNPWIYCRLAEVYLNYAEAKYYLGEESVAREYVNKVRERARGGKAGILPDVTESGDALLKKIQHERKVELAFEEHRWYDVRRWKIGKETQTGQFHGMTIIRKADGSKVYTLKDLQKRTFEDHHNLVPLPATEINKNSKLTQNPGY
ncbi:MAG: RagB/SusD family nutrient uptake outer membrane protein [Muribaculaceae bacterium]|nr:RagB/SusD family nutrient uptake outer membrane protein [Muribaculaceae bacterium]